MAKKDGGGPLLASTIGAGRLAAMARELMKLFFMLMGIACAQRA